MKVLRIPVYQLTEEEKVKHKVLYGRYVEILVGDRPS